MGGKPPQRRRRQQLLCLLGLGTALVIAVLSVDPLEEPPPPALQSGRPRVGADVPVSPRCDEILWPSVGGKHISKYPPQLFLWIFLTDCLLYSDLCGLQGDCDRFPLTVGQPVL